jgi:hypothetical protein
MSKNKTFIKKNIEDADQEACGNERQYSSAAFDILEREKIIEEFSHKGRSKIYCLTGYRPHILTLDEIFTPLLKQQENENVPVNKISF